MVAAMSDEEEWGEESTHSSSGGSGSSGSDSGSGSGSDWDSSWRLDDSEEEAEAEAEAERGEQRSAKAAGGPTAAWAKGRGACSSSYRGTWRHTRERCNQTNAQRIIHANHAVHRRL